MRAGGVEYLVAIYHDFDEEAILKKWKATAFKKPAYNSHSHLESLVLSGDWVEGLVRFLKHWRSCIGDEVLKELYQEPGPASDHTDRVLRVTGRLPSWSRLLTRRTFQILTWRRRRRWLWQGGMPEMWKSCRRT